MEMRELSAAPDKLAFGAPALMEGNAIVGAATYAGPRKSGRHVFFLLIAKNKMSS